MLLHLVRGLCQILRRHFVMPWIRHGTSQNCSRDSFPEVTAPCLRQRQAPAAQTCALEALEGCDLTAAQWSCLRQRLAGSPQPSGLGVGGAGRALGRVTRRKLHPGWQEQGRTQPAPASVLFCFFFRLSKYRKTFSFTAGF